MHTFDGEHCSSPPQTPSHFTVPPQPLSTVLLQTPSQACGFGVQHEPAVHIWLPGHTPQSIDVSQPSLVGPHASAGHACGTQAEPPVPEADELAVLDALAVAPPPTPPSPVELDVLEDDALEDVVETPVPELELDALAPVTGPGLGTGPKRSA